MAKKYYKKRSYTRYNNRSKYPIYKSVNSSVVSRAWKSIREANKSNSSLDFAFKINYAFTVRFGGMSNEGGNDSGVAVINIYDVLQQSENFQNMSKSWDQVKINGCTVKLNITDGQSSFSEENQYKSINIVTGWDRTGITPSNDVTFFTPSTVSGADPEEVGQTDWDDNNKPITAYINTIGSRITEGYGAKKGLLNQYQRFNRYEKIFPETLDEKCCYVSCGNINLFNGGFNVNSSVISLTGDYSSMNVQGILSAPNPAIPFENPAIKWKPTLLVGAFRTTTTSVTEGGNTTTVLTQYGKVNPIVFNGEFTIPVTFKGQKGDR